MFDADAIADSIARRAYTDSLDEGFDSPFAREARRNGRDYEGGKSDDISVIVGKVELLLEEVQSLDSKSQDRDKRPKAAETSTESTNLP